MLEMVKRPKSFLHPSPAPPPFEQNVSGSQQSAAGFKVDSPLRLFLAATGVTRHLQRASICSEVNSDSVRWRFGQGTVLVLFSLPKNDLMLVDASSHLQVATRNTAAQTEHPGDSRHMLSGSEKPLSNKVFICQYAGVLTCCTY